ncbi:LysR family transcriptional regulator [Loigolactobacillus bifermentans]|jgi:DNA-binding transcriptional LysR family regulator|uniref:Transcriptional regulator n=1 Tax=Loigolactobacillus bifermentans DSM 20003 TaxID=1423726 RepID=A0A0R1GY91_9LACO|nr:LysR family transcriptional regulator [Loigolactobacillus bifermentans]KRK36420.1 transcriptional regulator [Loigolactobacillus bifermentans DSM 20003]QGG60638.1 LysR family transcriptional regulator [Loigolactobacillus bifermentans]
MSTFSYEVFHAVVSHKTFYQAAVALNVTPSAVSHSINQLETELGFPVFIRNRTGVELTSDGARILPLIQQILNTEEQLRQEAASINGLNTGSIRLAAFSSVCINWLPPIIQDFKKRYPKIEISLVQKSNFNQIANQVKVGSVDLGFTALPLNEKLPVKPLIKDRIYCLTPKDFVPKNKTYITAEDVAGENFILQQTDYDKDTKRALDQYAVRPNAIRYSIDDQSIVAMVESGLGMGILPELALQNLSGTHVNVYPFDQDFFRTIALITNKVQVKAPSTRKMIQVITDYIQTRYPKNLLA